MHISIVANAVIQYFDDQQLNHPSYNPDLASNDEFLFSKLKFYLRGKNLSVINHFKDTNSEYSSSVAKLIHHSKEWTEIKDNYIAKIKMVVSFFITFLISPGRKLFGLLPRITELQRKGLVKKVYRNSFRQT